MVGWFFFFKEPAGTLNNGKLFLQTAVFLCFFFNKTQSFFFNKRNVVNEMRGSSESAPPRILQLCWDTSFCFVWIPVMRMELLLLTSVFLLSILIFFLISALEGDLALGLELVAAATQICVFSALFQGAWDFVLSVA